MTKPVVVCLCGSTKFREAFDRANAEETSAGKIVLTVGFSSAAPLSRLAKARLDVLHFRKIDLADEVLVLNVGGYIGESTEREVEYALSTGKRVRFLENK